MNKYIYAQSPWPNFYWDEKRINSILPPLRYKQGYLIGKMQAIGFPFLDEILLQTITTDVIKSSEIEGEILDPFQVRSSVARHLGLETAGLDKVDRNIEGVVEMVLDATQNYPLPLDEERILGWHASLFPAGRSGFRKINAGQWRKGPVEVISGRYGKEKIHFEVPPAERVAEEMQSLLDQFNSSSSSDPLIKAAIFHLWFVTIHPFEDGNGRIGRAIVDLILAQSENSSNRFYSLSNQIQKERKGYYEILEKTQKGTLDVTEWICWFLGCFERAVDDSNSVLATILKKAHFWEKIKFIPLNERQAQLINRLFDRFEGKLTTTKWAKMAKCSQDTAYRDILDLIEKKILVKNPDGGRSTSYSLLL